MVNQSNSQCLPTTGALAQSFQSFITQCRSTSDTANTTNLFGDQEIRDLFQKEQAQADDLILSLQNLNSLKNGAQFQIGSLDTRLSNLNKEKEAIEKEIEDKRNQIEAASADFLDNVSNAPKKSSLTGNFQDIALGSFFATLLLLALVLVFVQYTRPDGSLLASLWTGVAMTVFIIAVYALLKAVA